MKHIIIFCIVIFVIACDTGDRKKLTNMESENIRKTKISFSDKIIDFGVLSNDTIVQAIFYLKNVGSETLVVKNVSPECSCTGYKLDDYNIQPRDSTQLIVSFDTKGKLSGLQRKGIFIESNTEKEFNTLFIKCFISKN